MATVLAKNKNIKITKTDIDFLFLYSLNAMHPIHNATSISAAAITFLNSCICFPPKKLFYPYFLTTSRTNDLFLIFIHTGLHSFYIIFFKFQQGTADFTCHPAFIAILDYLYHIFLFFLKSYFIHLLCS